MYNNYANNLFKNQGATISDSMNMYNFNTSVPKYRLTKKHIGGANDDANDDDFDDANDDANDDDFDGGFPPFILKKNNTDKKNPSGFMQKDNKYIVSIHKILDTRKKKKQIVSETESENTDE